MRLLIVTQAVDRDDPVLGFFHRWIGAFADQCDSVEVIAQRTGPMHFDSQKVRVQSLGKEKGHPRLLQILRFWLLVIGLRGKYDAVLVHMTPVWAVLGAPLFGMPVFLWYEARGGGWALRCALRIVHKVFSASQRGMPLATTKSVIVGHGIDTETFAPSSSPRDPQQIVTVGRVTQSKRLEVIVSAVGVLPDYHLRIVGGPITAADRQYHVALEERLRKEHAESRITIGPLSPRETVSMLQHATLFLHASETALDKALLEAMACGCLTVSCSEAAAGVLPPECLATPETMASTVQALLALPPDAQEALRDRLRRMVVEQHSLPRLIDRLVTEMQVRERAG